MLYLETSSYEDYAIAKATEIKANELYKEMNHSYKSFLILLTNMLITR